MGPLAATSGTISGKRRYDAAWREHALCKNLGPARFYSRASEVTVARCRCCPVGQICFWYALVCEERDGYRFGIWGGATPALRDEVAAMIPPGYALGRLRDLLAEMAGPAQ